MSQPQRDLVLDLGGFTLHFQPKLDLLTGDVIGAEALLRLFDAERRSVPPRELIAVAEATGLIAAVGEWVLKEACAQARKWSDAGLPTIPVAVNLSAVELRRPELAETVSRVMHETGLESDRLEFEITESAMTERGIWWRTRSHVCTRLVCVWPSTISAPGARL